MCIREDDPHHRACETPQLLLLGSFTLLLFVILGAATSGTGEDSGYGVMLTWLFIYFICLPVVLYITKRMQNQLLR